MSQPLVSIIIPLYNRKHLISRCVKSVCDQTYTNLEIIVVDDGSTDEPDEVLTELANDTRIKILRKTNGGVSSARNLGLDTATGEYVMFLDSDDAMMRTAAEWCVESMERDQADCVTFSFYHCGPSQTPTLPPTYKSKVHRGDDCITATFRAFRQCSMCNKMYRRELIDDLRVPQNVSWGEDFIFSFTYLQRCRVLVALNAKLINVTPDSPGSLNKRFSPTGFQDAEAQYEVIHTYLQKRESAVIAKLTNRYMWGCYIACVRKLCLFSPMSYKEQISTLKQWSQSALAQWLKPELCPPVLDCRMVMAQWYVLIPLAVRLISWKMTYGNKLRHIFRH